MLGGNKLQPLGYTIVEVMIFMAISGIMFLLAATFISGKQANAQFKQGMNDMNSQIMNVINEVSNGDYTDLGTNTCTATAVTNGAPTIQSGSAAQGSNIGCVFLGKVIQIPVGNQKSQYAVFTAVGRQTDANTGDATQTFTTANPIVADATPVGAPSSVTLTQVRETSYGLELTDAKECTSNCAAPAATFVNIGAFGFFGSFGGYVSAAASNQSGAQQVVTAVVPATYNSPAYNQAGMATQLNQQLHNINATGTDVISGGKLIRLCFKYNDKYGSITIGGATGQQLTTSVNMGYSAGCTL